MDILLGTALGVLIGFVLAVPAIILETSRRVKNLPLLVDVQLWGDKKLSEGELFAAALLFHFVVAALYGGLYVVFVQYDLLFVTHAPYTLQSMLIFALGGWLVLNAVLLPIIGLGFFGRGHGKTIWFETLISLMLEGAILWMLIQYYQPIFFS
jgi:hypothetical protein